MAHLLQLRFGTPPILCGWGEEVHPAFMLAFFDEVLGQLQPHHQLADLGPGPGQIALLRLCAASEPSRAGLQEDPLPALQLVRGDLALARDRVHGLPAQ